jgi:diamine N-acetyltransferase
MRLRAAGTADLDLVLAAEADPDAAPYIIRWSRERHAEALADPDQAQMIVEADDGPIGFVLLAGLAGGHRNVELRRIVIAPRGRGLGRRALALVLDHAFGTLGAHRVWLDVKVHNERARRAYAAAGFVDEGILRDALLTDGVFESLAVMSVIEQDWAARAGGGSPV